MTAQKNWKKMGMLAGVADCGRSQKWGCRGRLALGFIPRSGSHDKRNHTALGLPLPHSLGSWKARCSSNAELSLSSLKECRRDAAGRKGIKGLLLVGQEAMWFWIKNWRSRAHSGWCWEPREAGQLSTDYWEEPGAT